METIFKIQVKNPTKSLHNQVAASKAPEIWVAADSMKLDSSSSGRITKPQRIWSQDMPWWNPTWLTGTPGWSTKIWENPENQPCFEGENPFCVGSSGGTSINTALYHPGGFQNCLEVQNCPGVKDWKSRKISEWHKSPCEVSKLIHLELHEPLRIANDLPL